VKTKILALPFLISKSPRLAGVPGAGKFLAALFCLSMLLPNQAEASGIALKEIAHGFTSPIALVPLDDGSGRLLVADQTGAVHVLSKEGTRSETVFLDVSGRLSKLNQGFDERGLLGLALHPGFKENGRVFIYYSAPLRDGGPEGWDHTSHISEFKVTRNDAARVDPNSERLVLQIDQPQFNHNGGALVFGPDGFLYISVGDGGNANDTGLGHSPEGNGQDRSNLMGTILRIDVDGEQPYAVPSDNPFVGKSGRPEIYAYGLRNAWRISFDRGGDREFFAADVGQNAFEEVNIIRKGGNYGWNIREGFHCFDSKDPNRPLEDCPKTGRDGEPLLDPILEYRNFKAFPRHPEARGISITGGYVYRGQALQPLRGRYVFADWSQHWALPKGILFVATRPESGNGVWEMKSLELANHPTGEIEAYITAFGEDADGELYVLTNGRNSITGNTGKVFKLVPQ
jgi:glucose/arabinose dehydrogenase